jgi:hypothetical protein
MKGKTMKFIHHNTGEWVRPDWHTATRTDPIVTEYNSIDDIHDKFIRQTFEWMLEVGEIVTSSGSNVYQIRMK